MLADMFMYMYVYEKIRNVSFVLIDMLGCTCTCMCLWKDQDCFFYVGRHARLVSLLQKLRGTLNPETSLSLCKGASHPVLHQTECVHNQMDKVREYLPHIPVCVNEAILLCNLLQMRYSCSFKNSVYVSVFLVYKTLWARLKKKIQLSSSFNFAYLFSSAISRTLFHSIVICELFIETSDIFKYIHVHVRLKFHILVNYRTQQKRLI